MKKLDYFIVGTQKGGTTALFKKMTSNEQFYRQTKKEIHFFDRENIDWENPSYTLLNKHFQDAPTEKYWGDATPIYMYWPNAIARLHNYNEDAKIIVILRHPSYRALSHWKMETAREEETLDFLTATSENRKNRESSPEKYLRRYSYVERGFYFQQIICLLKYFDRKNIFFCTTDELFISEVGLLNRIYRFIGAKATYTETQKKIIKPQNNDNIETSEQWLTHLHAIYMDDIEKTATLTGLDLGIWNDAHYTERPI